MKQIPEWLKDWMDFQNEKSSEESLPSQFKFKIQNDLNPSSGRVLFKVVAIHIITSIVTLSFCPQLGVGGFFSDTFLMQALMAFGHEVCFFLCGALFISGSMVMARLFLEVEERRRLFKDQILVWPTLLTFSLGGLQMLGEGTHPLDHTVWYWALGFICAAVLGSHWLLKPSTARRV